MKLSLSDTQKKSGGVCRISKKIEKTRDLWWIYHDLSVFEWDSYISIFLGVATHERSLFPGPKICTSYLCCLCICHGCKIWLVVSTHLKNMTSSVGMMKFPTEWKVIKNMFQSTNQPFVCLILFSIGIMRKKHHLQTRVFWCIDTPILTISNVADPTTLW